MCDISNLSWGYISICHPIRKCALCLHHFATHTLSHTLTLLHCMTSAPLYKFIKSQTVDKSSLPEQAVELMENNVIKSSVGKVGQHPPDRRG